MPAIAIDGGIMVLLQRLQQLSLCSRPLTGGVGYDGPDYKLISWVCIIYTLSTKINAAYSWWFIGSELCCAYISKRDWEGRADRQSHIGRWCALNSPAKPNIHPPKTSTTITASMREIMSLAAHRVVIGGTRTPFFRTLIMSIWMNSSRPVTSFCGEVYK